jgi:hypothetical protein
VSSHFGDEVTNVHSVINLSVVARKMLGRFLIVDCMTCRVVAVRHYRLLEGPVLAVARYKTRPLWLVSLEVP